MDDVAKYLHHKLFEHSECWYPMLAVFYLTYECRFRCPYCSDGFGRPYHALKENVLAPEDAVAVIRRIRGECDRLVLTGGEPTLYPALDDVLWAVREMKFKQVILTTNAADLWLHLPSVAACVTDLVVSLDTLDHERADRWSGVGPGTLEGILETIEAARIRRGYRICVSAVVTPGNIADLYDVYRYARERDLLFSASPQLVGVTPHEALVGNPEYRALYDFLIREKRSGAKVFGTVLYLRHMRDLRRFTCHPFTMLVVSPSGEVFYPCLERGRPVGNLRGGDPLHALRKKGRELFGPPPRCDNQCHSPCALGFALALDFPWSILTEGVRMFAGRFRSTAHGKSFSQEHSYAISSDRPD